MGLKMSISDFLTLLKINSNVKYPSAKAAIGIQDMNFCLLKPRWSVLSLAGRIGAKGADMKL